MIPFWSGQLDSLANFLENEPVQYDLYLDDEHIGGISAIGPDIDAWVVGYTLSYHQPYQEKTPSS